MSKITLDRETFKALASDTRLNILKTLDGKQMSLNDLCSTTKLNKATLHEHLTKLHEAGLIKKHEREGHKWVYYRLTWKGESLLHPENTRIVILFSTAFILLWVGLIQIYWYVKGTVINLGYDMYTYGENVLLTKSFSGLGSGVTNTSGGCQNIPFYIPESLREFLTGYKTFVPNSSGIPFPSHISVLNGNMSSVENSTSPLFDGLSSLGEQTADTPARFVVDTSDGVIRAISQNPVFLYLAIACFCAFMVVLCVSLWRFSVNRTQKL
ncbi:MAG: metalloregulator ArsR/SmtB family transcription factor [Candidatus Thermoplasmatota archaeon]